MKKRRRKLSERQLLIKDEEKRSLISQIALLWF
jgi:hypothetical protein